MFHNISELIAPALAAFLRKEGVYEAFVANCPNKVGELSEHYITVGIDSFLGCPFTYFDSPQGSKYWEDLSNKFEATLPVPSFPDTCVFEESFNRIFKTLSSDSKSTLDQLI